MISLTVSEIRAMLTSCTTLPNDIFQINFRGSYDIFTLESQDSEQPK